MIPILLWYLMINLKLPRVCLGVPGWSWVKLGGPEAL